MRTEKSPSRTACNARSSLRISTSSRTRRGAVAIGVLRLAVRAGRRRTGRDTLRLAPAGWAFNIH